MQRQLSGSASFAPNTTALPTSSGASSWYSRTWAHAHAHGLLLQLMSLAAACALALAAALRAREDTLDTPDRDKDSDRLSTDRGRAHGASCCRDWLADCVGSGTSITHPSS